ncbi:MAG TPA: retropepsin-like aspartic protease [Candidatus Elarobacter sp.]
MIPLAAASFARAQPAAAAPANPDIRVIRSRDGTTRYVRLRVDTRGSGISGSEVSLIDLRTGRSTDSVKAGPLSFGDGFDGSRAWSSDATGMASPEQNAQVVQDVRAWSHFLGRRGPEQPAIRRVESAGKLILQLRYAGLPGRIDVAFDRRTGLVASIDDRTGPDVAHATFADYRTVGGVILPFASTSTTRYGVWQERVRAVEFPRTLAPEDFAPPPPPDDVRLDGDTTIPMTLVAGVPVVPIRIDDGPVLHVLFDSGASNDLKPRAAKRLGLRLVGDGKSGGMGAGLARQRYTTVKSLRIGDAELTNQPFTVVDDDSFGPAVDGAIGCEVFQRFAVRFDFARKRVDLTRDVRHFGITAPPISIRLSGCTPEVDGALDGLRGPISIDTGSGAPLDVMSPFVRAHDLVARYRVTTPALATGTGVGGVTRGYIAVARELRLGPVVINNVPIVLGAMSTGALADTSELGNAGSFLLRKFTPVFDYRSSRMWLLR